MNIPLLEGAGRAARATAAVLAVDQTERHWKFHVFHSKVYATTTPGIMGRGYPSPPSGLCLFYWGGKPPNPLIIFNSDIFNLSATKWASEAGSHWSIQVTWLVESMAESIFIKRGIHITHSQKRILQCSKSSICLINILNVLYKVLNQYSILIYSNGASIEWTNPFRISVQQ